MPKITYEDYEYASEEEKNKDKDTQRSMDYSEDEGSDSASNDGNPLDEAADVDEYAAFATDLEKYNYDLRKWNDIQNTRKYVTKKKKNKGEDERKQEHDVEEGTKRPGKSRKLPNSLEEETPTQDPTVQNPEEEGIDFDATGNMWYSYHKDSVFICERVTFHHWIRAALSQMENSTGTYVFPRKRGPGNYDVTCFSKVQQHWGLQRPHYAPVMFEWERLNRKNPNYQLGNLYHEGLLVLDYWRTPVRHFHEIPLVVSSEFEGGFMEPATRLHSKMKYEDIRARMPPFIEVVKNRVTTTRPLSKSTTFSERCRRFREEAGAITWYKRGSEGIKSFIENIVKPVNNSTRWSRDLTTKEVKKMRLVNGGTKPLRAKPETTREAKENYIAKMRRAAEDDHTQELETEDEEMTEAKDGAQQEPTDEGWEISHEDGYDQLLGGQDNQSLGGPLGLYEDIYRGDNFMLSGMIITAAPRMLFNCMTPPLLRAMTEEEAANDAAVDSMDPRNHVPKLAVEVTAIRDALEVTIDHFKALFGFEPTVSEGSNYNSEYCNIQDQMDERLGDDATALCRLKRWEGTISDWKWAEVENDPCFGRRRPPFF